MVCGLHSCVINLNKSFCFAPGKGVFWGSLVKLYRSNEKRHFRLHSVFFLNGYNLKRQKIASFAFIALPKIRQVKTVSSLQERISRIKY